MFGSLALELSIGLVLVFLLVSLALTAVVESFEAWLKTRSAYLERALAELLRDVKGDGLRNAFYNHPLITSLYPGIYTPTVFDTNGKVKSRGAGARRLPTYIPREHFSLALLDLARTGELDQAGTEQVERAVRAAMAVSCTGARPTSGNPDVASAVNSLQASATGEIQRLRKELEDWYDGAMDRASGWYRRGTHLTLFLLGLGMALILNINAVTIGQVLATNPTLAASVGDLAERTVRQYRLPPASSVEEKPTGISSSPETTLPLRSNNEAADPAVHANVPQPPIDPVPGSANVENASSEPRSGAAAELAARNGDGTNAAEDSRRMIEPDELATEIRKSVLAIGLPIGWGGDARTRIKQTFYSEEGLVIDVLEGLVLLAGYLITAFVATIGAPFWFDVLNKLIVIRSTVKPKEKSRD